MCIYRSAKIRLYKEVTSYSVLIKNISGCLGYKLYTIKLVSDRLVYPTFTVYIACSSYLVAEACRLLILQ